jgi:hypothetical protein
MNHAIEETTFLGTTVVEKNKAIFNGDDSVINALDVSQYADLNGQSINSG